MIKPLFFYRQHDKAQHLNPLDGLRALAILFVIIFHAFFLSQYGFENLALFSDFSSSIPWYLHWIKRGDLGVDIFFVLSAFLIGYQLFNEKNRSGSINFKHFYLKRFLRIYPVYLFALLLFVIAKGWDYQVLGNIFAYNNLFNLKEIVIPWSWSLSVEIQFYVIAPLAIYCILKLRKRILIAITVIAFSLLWNAYFYFTNSDLQSNSVLDLIIQDNEVGTLHYLQFLYVAPPARIGSFVVGLAAAFLWAHHKEGLFAYHLANQKRTGVVLFGIFISLLLMASVDLYVPKASLSAMGHMLYSITMVAGRLLFSIGIGLMILACLATMQSPGFTYKFLSHPVFYPIARGSYSMYLFHPYFLFMAYYILFGESKLISLSQLELWSLALLGILLSFLFSIFTYYAIERWFFVKPKHERI